MSYHHDSTNIYDTICLVSELILIRTCCFCFEKSLDAGVCTAYSLRWTKREPQIVLSDLEQGCSYGPLVTRGAETKLVRSIEVQTQGE